MKLGRIAAQAPDETQRAGNSLMTSLRKLVLWVFNKVFSANVRFENIQSIKVAAREDLRITPDNARSLRLLLQNDLKIEEGDIASVRLLLREQLHFGEEDIATIRLAVMERRRFGANYARARLLEGLAIQEDDVPSIRLMLREGLRFTEDDIASIRLMLKEGLRLADEQVDSIRLIVAEHLRLEPTDIPAIRDVTDRHAPPRLSYSQEGESLILERLLQDRATGFYVDVGAHHPKRFSNTYGLYKRGWRGVNIDPTPGTKELFEADRPRDTFIATAVSNEESPQDFFMFTESALNTFNKGLAEQYQKDGCKLVEVRPLASRRLSSVLDECQPDQPIDLMSIDVEGCELGVLQSNDWAKYRPRLLLVEILDFDLSRPGASPVHNFLIERGYALLAKTYNTVFYRDESAKSCQAGEATSGTAAT